VLHTKSHSFCSNIFRLFYVNTVCIIDSKRYRLVCLLPCGRCSSCPPINACFLAVFRSTKQHHDEAFISDRPSYSK